MATIKYSLRGTKNPAKLYCRFVNGRATDIVTPINLLLNPKHWDAKQEKIRNVIEVRNRDEINRKLALLKIDILDRFNFDFMSGEIIDRDWLNKVISDSFNRPKNENKGRNKNHTVYYTDFATWWLEKKADGWLVGPGKYMNERIKGQYTNFIASVVDFEGKSKLKINQLGNEKIAEFIQFLIDDSYSPATVKRHIGRMRFFLNRAEEMNINTDSSYKQRVFIPKAEVVKEPYFNPAEIEDIYKHDFSDDDKLDNVRDNLIIACWTGLRVSDFLQRLDTSNFIDDFIEIKTQKTGTNVVIPVHPMVKKILIKRNGKMPRKISDQKFNVYVKEVCKAVGFKSKMKGKLHHKEKNRDVLGMYEKYKLISSHIGRRSFATNHYGKINDSVIMGVCGWSSKEMMLNYIQTSNREHAVELKKYWEEIYN